MTINRLALLTTLFIISAGTASADYVLIKINIEKMDFFPKPKQGMQGNKGGMGGVPMGGVPMKGMMGGGVMGFMGGGAMGFMGGKPFPGNMMGGMGGMMGKGMNNQGGVTGGFGMGGAMGMGGANFLGGTGPMPGQPPSLSSFFPMIEKKVDPEEEPGKWLSAYVELKNSSRLVPVPPYGAILQYDHKWGVKNWLPISPQVPMIGAYLPQESHAKEFDIKLNKDKKDKVKNIDNYLYLARWALKHGMMNKFHIAMKEATEINRKDPTVLDYLRVQKDLTGPFKELDPAQAELVEELRANGYKPYVSEQGHYAIYAQIFSSDDRGSENTVKRRLAMLETTLETFYYWFALQGNSSPQPALPKYRLTAVLASSKQEFLTRHLQWGGMPMVADGFTPRRPNLLIMPSKPRQTDPRFVEFDTILKNQLADANAKLQQIRLMLTPDELLSGKTNEVKTAGMAAIFVAAAQTAVVLHKALEDEAERATITNEGIRQLLIASEMFPRNVQIPDWMVEGLAAFFETPMGAPHATVGAPNWMHLISFKHLRNTRHFDKAPDVLFNVVTDRYFQDARRLSAEALEFRDDEALHDEATRAWEMARSSAWSFVYYLAENRELKYLFRYGKELDKLPRDLDLDDLVLQSCFAKAFEMTDPKDARRIETKRLGNMAENWFTKMQGTNLDLLAIQTYLLQQRAQQDVQHKGSNKDNPKKTGTDTPAVTNPTTPVANPMPQPQANPAQPQQNPGPPATVPGTRPRPPVRPPVRQTPLRPAGS